MFCRQQPITMSSTKQIGDVDAALIALNSLGAYTLVQFGLLLIADVSVIYQMMSIVFTGQKNPFRCPVTQEFNTTNLTFVQLYNSTADGFNSVCQMSGNGVEVWNLSNSSPSCEAMNVEYKLPKNFYFTSEFDLVCEREYLAGLTQTLLILGHGIGSLTFPYFADRYGRKPIILLASVLCLGSSLGQALSTNYAMLTTFKSLTGVFNQGILQTEVTALSEVLIGSQRGFMFGCVGSIGWTVALLISVPVAYFLRNDSWRTLELIMISFYAYIILYIFFLDEPLRWLAANGLRKRVMKVLKRASRWNGRNSLEVISAFNKESEMHVNSGKTTDENIDGSANSAHSDECQDLNFESTVRVDGEKLNLPLTGEKNGMLPHLAHEDEENLNFLSLFKYPILRVNITFCLFAWCFNSLTYYALMLMSSTLSGSLYLNYTLNCLVEIPQAIFCYFYIDRLGRKKCFVMFSVLAGLSLLGAAFTSAVYPEEDLAIKILTIFGKFSITGSFNVLYTLTPELFPTNVRAMSIGVASMSARVGGMLAPFAEMLMAKAIYAPAVVFGLSSLLLSLMTYFLPETAGKQLPQSLKDMQKWKNETVKTKSILQAQISVEIMPANKTDEKEKS